MLTTAATIDLPSHPQKERKAKVIRTKAQWKALLDELNGSGLTKSAFCKSHQISTSSLHKWQKHFSAQSTAAEFVDITGPLSRVAPPLPIPKDDNHWQVELELGSGMVLRVRAI